jgi:hypothetical protein
MVGTNNKEAIFTMDKKNIGKRNNTMTQKIISKIGLEEIEKIWIQFGMYRGAEELSKLVDDYISPSTIRYLSQKYDWKRPVNPRSPILVGVKRGTIPSSYYKHLIFPEEITNEKD